MEQTDSGCRRGRGRGGGWKEAGGISPRTYMSDSWTQTVKRGLTVGKRGGLGGGEKRETLGTTIIE